jgi:hypothetical protein
VEADTVEGPDAADRVGVGAIDWAEVEAVERAGVGAIDWAEVEAERVGVGAIDWAEVEAVERVIVGALDRAEVETDRVVVGAIDCVDDEARDRAGGGDCCEPVDDCATDLGTSRATAAVSFDDELPGVALTLTVSGG